MAKDKIVVIGSLNYDMVLKVPHLPVAGETLPADETAFSAGGKGANQAVQASKLGIPVYMIGCVGKDYQGDFMLESAEKYGVNTSFIRRTDQPTGMGVVNAAPDGSVMATIVRGANYAVSREDIDNAENLLKEAAIVILQMEIPQEINMYAIDKAKSCGCKVLINAAPAEEMPEAYMEKCDIIVVNEVEAGFYLGRDITSPEEAEKGAGEMADRYGADIIMTLGAAGAVVSDAGRITFIPSKKVDAIETTGAGDSFIGGVGYSLMQGMDLTEACRFATRCSAVTVCRLGAQDSMPTLEEIND